MVRSKLMSILFEAKAAAVSAVLSVDPSSTIMISLSRYDCLSSSPKVSTRSSAEL